MLLRYYGYPQRQPSIPGYCPAVPELHPAARDGTGAIRVGKGTNLEGFVGSELLEAARREDAAGLGGGAASAVGPGQGSCLRPSEMWCLSPAGEGLLGLRPTWHLPCLAPCFWPESKPCAGARSRDAQLSVQTHTGSIPVGIQARGPSAHSMPSSERSAHPNFGAGVFEPNPSKPMNSRPAFGEATQLCRARRAALVP